MTETSPNTDASLFTAVQLEEFEADDVIAGSAIGKMLSILFLYTVLVMSFVGVWTFTQNANEAETTQEASVDH